MINRLKKLFSRCEIENCVCKKKELTNGVEPYVEQEHPLIIYYKGEKNLPLLEVSLPKGDKTILPYKVIHVGIPSNINLIYVKYNRTAQRKWTRNLQEEYEYRRFLIQIAEDCLWKIISKLDTAVSYLGKKDGETIKNSLVFLQELTKELNEVSNFIQQHTRYI